MADLWWVMICRRWSRTMRTTSWLTVTACTPTEHWQCDGEGRLSRFYADVTRSGADWIVYVTGLELSFVVRHHGEIATRARDLIGSMTGMSSGRIDLVVRSERDRVRARATQLGFVVPSDFRSRTEVYELPSKTRFVSVRYDDFGAVVDVDATTQLAEFPATWDGAFEALFYTAQYSDIRRRRLRKDVPPDDK